MQMKTLFFLVFLATGALAADLTFDQAKARAVQDETSLSEVQNEALVKSQGRAAGDSFAKCPAPTPNGDLSPFSLVMELDASGKVVRTWLKGNSSIAICFRSEMASKSLFKPPQTPFFTSFDMSWER